MVNYLIALMNTLTCGQPEGTVLVIANDVSSASLSPEHYRHRAEFVEQLRRTAVRCGTPNLEIRCAHEDCVVVYDNEEAGSVLSLARVADQVLGQINAPSWIRPCYVPLALVEATDGRVCMAEPPIDDLGVLTEICLADPDLSR